MSRSGVDVPIGFSSLKLRCGLRHGFHADLRQQPPPLPDLADRPGQMQCHAGRDVLGAAAEAELHVTRLDDALAGQTGERGEVGRDREGHACRLAGLKRYPLVADQPHHRLGGLRHRVVQVQLHDLGARPLAGVADRHAEGHLAVDWPGGCLGRGSIVGHVRAGQAGVGPLERRVAKAVPEREGGSGIHRRHLGAAPELRGQVGSWQAAGVPGDPDRQPP
jgi:hypothetical protein